MSNPAVIHSKLGFSARKRWRGCPPSVALSVGLPDKESPAAKEGTCAHTVAEFYVRQAYHLPGAAAGEAPFIVPPVELDLKNRTPEEWNEELRKHGHAYVTFIRSLIPAGYKAFVTIEQRVAIPSISDQLFGTADCIIWIPDLGLVIVVDYKFGFEDVEVGEVDTFAPEDEDEEIGNADDVNPQLAAYLVAAIETFKLPARACAVAVFQPRRVIGEPGQSLELPIDWLPRERAKLTREVAATQRPGEPTADKHCRYCRAKPICPRTHEALAEVVANYVGEMNLHTMSDDEVVQLWACRTAFKGFWEDVQERIKALAKAGHDRLGITTKDGRRKWRDKDEVALTLLALGRSDLLAPKTLSEVYDRLPENIRDTLIGRTLPVRTITLVEPGTPSETAKLFKKYSRIVDERVKVD